MLFTLNAKSNSFYLHYVQNKSISFAIIAVTCYLCYLMQIVYDICTSVLWYIIKSIKYVYIIIFIKIIKWIPLIGTISTIKPSLQLTLTNKQWGMLFSTFLLFSSFLLKINNLSDVICDVSSGGFEFRSIASKSNWRVNLQKQKTQ